MPASPSDEMSIYFSDHRKGRGPTLLWRLSQTLTVGFLMEAKPFVGAGVQNRKKADSISTSYKAHIHLILYKPLTIVFRAVRAICLPWHRRGDSVSNRCAT